jgi:hypothetical protein
MAILPILLPFWYMLWPFGIFCGHFGIFFPFWYLEPRKIWQPCVRPVRGEASEAGLIDKVEPICLTG